jgi:hypothetical protein
LRQETCAGPEVRIAAVARDDVLAASRQRQGSRCRNPSGCSSTADAIGVPLSENVTVPVGVPVASCPMIVAVDVYACPTTDGLSAEARAVDVTPVGEARALGAPRIAPDTITHAAIAIFIQPIFGMPRSRPRKGFAAIVPVAGRQRIGHLPGVGAVPDGAADSATPLWIA